LLREDGREQIRRRFRFEKISTARIGVELGRRQRRFLRLRLFLPKEIAAPKSPMRMEAATVNLNFGSPVAPTIDFHDCVLAAAGNLGPARLAALAIDLSKGLLAVAEVFGPFRLAKIVRNLNPGLLVAATVDLNARSFFAWLAVVTGCLFRRVCDDQCGTRNKHPSGSRTDRWAGRGHRGAKDAERVSPWQA
jgi:hypothetical protein